MNKQRIQEIYRSHTLLAALDKGSLKGRVWGPDKQMLTEVSGTSLKEVIEILKAFVDKSFLNKEGANSPGVNEYVRALKGVLADLPDSYLRMLKAHYHAPNRTMTTSQLAEAGAYANYNAAVLHYGKFGARLYEQLPVKLPRHKDGKLIYTHMLATEGNIEEEELLTPTEN